MNRNRIFAVVIFSAFWLIQLGQNQSLEAQPKVSAIPDDVRKVFNLDDFYQKYTSVHGLPVVGSSKVSDAAILEASWIIQKMLGDRPDILKALAKNKTRLAVMAFNEYTTDVPEHRHLKSKVYWDRRARGLGATRSAPAVSCGEENLLSHPNDPYHLENICIHEFAHAIHGMGMPEIDHRFDDNLKRAYDKAMAAGLWKETYAAVNRQEYWAEGVQSWFDDNRENDALHNEINTRTELKKYDPDLAKLCEQVFGDSSWKYSKPKLRKESERKHLNSVDFENLPKFSWRDEPIPDSPKVLIQTSIGDVEVELNYKKAPKTVANFLHYVHQGFYSDGEFHRTVRDDNQPKDKPKIQVIQASADSKRRDEFLPPIELERTKETGLSHLAGTISMARELKPDTALDHFFICIEDEPELDFGGKRDKTGQGYAAFGKVTKGMDIVKKIHQSPAKNQKLKPTIRIQRAIRLN